MDRARPRKQRRRRAAVIDAARSWFAYPYTRRVQAQLSALTDRAGLRINPASWRDLRRIVGLERICFGADSWPWPEVLLALALPYTVSLKAEIQDELVGFVIGDRRSRIGWIASIGVLPSYRRRGIGRQLLELCEAQLGTSVIRLSLRKTNDPALSMYRGLGYTQVEVWPRYYHDGEDALVMERSRA